MSESYDMAAGRWSENDLLCSRFGQLLRNSPYRGNPDYIRAIADVLEITQDRHRLNDKAMMAARSTSETDLTPDTSGVV